MSLNQNLQEKNLFKALHWLNNQPNHWAQHITDSKVALKMYLKSQNKKQKPSNNFSKEINKVLKAKKEEKAPFQTQSLTQKEDIGAFLTKRKEPLVSSLSKKQSQSLPAKTKPVKEKEEELVLLEKKEVQPFYLDEISLQTVKQIKKNLNMEQEEEVLRLLIQLGQHSLQKLISNSL